MHTQKQNDKFRIAPMNNFQIAPIKMVLKIFVTSLVLFGAAELHANPLRDHLSLFFEFNALDSVIALEQKSATTLQVTVVDGATGETRKLSENLAAKPMQKLLSESNDLGLKTIPLVGKGETKTESNGEEKKNAKEKSASSQKLSDSTTAKNSSESLRQNEQNETKTPRSVSSPRKNRMWYIGSQTALSTYIYGLSIPLAFDVKSTRVKIAAPMIAAPFAFGAHFWFSKSRPFEDSHRMGINYLSLASIYASYALPYTFLPSDSSSTYQTASILTLFAYPAGIYGGYLLGDKYIDQPGRVDIEEKFALGFATMGFFTPFLYFDRLEGNGEAFLRLALGQSLVMGVGGHFLADTYRTGENIPAGVNLGIVHHAVLGLGLGLEVAALSDAETPRPWIGSALFGGTLGFMEGLYYYRKSYDSQERGLYNTLGGLAGTLLGGGFAALFLSDNSSAYTLKVGITSLLVGGTFLGYTVTNILTDGMEEKSATSEFLPWTRRLALNPVPFPEPQILDHGNFKEIYWRYRMPGISYTF